MNGTISTCVPAAQQRQEQLLDSLAQRLHDGTLRTRQLGNLGEQYAAAWLEAQGWHVIDRNWHCRLGELDIVARNESNQIVFVEVKTRRTLRYGTPQEAVTHAKQINLRHAAVQWLAEPEHHLPHSGIRFDVVTVVVREGNPLVHRIEGAF
jgi:putative endonuclease